MSAYYNEFDPKAASTLRELIREDLIAPGDVDERSIKDVLPSELIGYTQVHLFAGFGIWSLAFRMAGWPDSRPVWSASCPCQPFSAAGKGGGFADDRHLWPAAFWLLQHGKRAEIPIYGEQVASPDGLTWLDLVRADLETIEHSLWSTVLASAGFGAPIMRQRSYWMASAASERHTREFLEAETGISGTRSPDGDINNRFKYAGPSISIGMEWTESERRGEARGNSGRPEEWPGYSGELSRVGSADHAGLEGRVRTKERSNQLTTWPPSLVGGNHGSYVGYTPVHDGPGPTNGFWRDVDWLRCRDDKWRPVEPGTFPLAHGYPERVGILRGAGNAISPQVAAYFIWSTM